jgi:hypothetical protein
MLHGGFGPVAGVVAGGAVGRAAGVEAGDSVTVASPPGALHPHVAAMKVGTREQVCSSICPFSPAVIISEQVREEPSCGFFTTPSLHGITSNHIESTEREGKDSDSEYNQHIKQPMDGRTG